MAPNHTIQGSLAVSFLKLRGKVSTECKKGCNFMGGAKNKRGITHLKMKRMESEKMWPGEGFNWSNLYSKSRKARFYCVQTRLFSTEVVDLKETKRMSVFTPLATVHIYYVLSVQTSSLLLVR